MHKALIADEEVDDFVIIRVRAFARKIQNAILQEALAGENIPVLEWQLMFSIARFGSCHLAFINSKTAIDPAHGSRAVAALEMKGLVERREDPENRRRKLISLTEEGKKTFERIWPQTRDLMRRVTDQMDETDFEEFKRLLGLINTYADVLADDQTKENTRHLVKQGE